MANRRANLMSEEHVGEWKVTIMGRTLEDVFEATARVIANAAGRSDDDLPTPWELVVVSARDMPTLLVDWANELIGRSEVNGVAYSELRFVSIAPLSGSSVRVSAHIRGRRVTHWTSPLKAATYHSLSLEQRGTEWRAEVLFDV